MTEEIIEGKPPGMPGRIPLRIKTERLTLCCPRVADGPALHEAIVESVERLDPWFAWPAGAALTLERSIATTRFARWRFLAGRELQFLIFDANRQLLGLTGLCNPDWSRRHFEIGYWLRSGCEGEGYATEAVGALTHFALRQLDARQLEIRCDPENEAAVALARRLGYTLEAVLPRTRHDPHTGTWHDVAIFVQIRPGNRTASGGL